MRNSHDWRRFCTCSENLSTAADRLDRSSIITVALFALSAILASSDRNCVPYVSSSRSTTNPHRRANAAIDSLRSNFRLYFPTKKIHYYSDPISGRQDLGNYRIQPSECSLHYLHVVTS